MDENYQCLKDEATKTEQALENAKNEKEAQKAKLKSIYKAMNKTDEELNSIFSEIESDRKIPDMPLHEDYHKSYWKWKDADEANEKAQTAKDKYNENLNADIPDVMIQLKEVRNELQEVKNEMQEMKAMLPQTMMQVLRDFERQRQEEFFKNIITNLSGKNQEKDIQFPAPIEARYITFHPKQIIKTDPILRCDVYVDGQLQTTPESRRSASSYLSDNVKTSTLNAERGWCPKEKKTKEWLKLDLGSRQRITGIRVGSRKDCDEYITKLALSFE